MKKTFSLPLGFRGPLVLIQSVGLLGILTSFYIFLCRPLGAAAFAFGGLYALLAGIFIGGLEGFRFGEKRVFDLALAQWLGLLLAAGVSWIQLCLMVGALLNPLPLLGLALIQGAAAWALTRLFHLSHRRLFRPRRTALVCGSHLEGALREKLLHRQDKYRLDRILSGSNDFESLCRELEGCEAAVFSGLDEALRNRLLKFCYGKGIRVYVVPEVTDLLLRFGKTVTAFDTPMVLVRSSGLTLRQRICKRALDALLVTAALIPAAPVMALVALAIRLEDGGPIFYRQKRMTQNGREFDILKFRSMIPDAEKFSGAVLASENDPRITKVGRFIRATRLDELPQLLNILKGDMSIVGPRPERPQIAEGYRRELPEFDYRLKVPGGLTGYAQIYGKYNTTPADKLRLDMIYIENYSILLDIRLMLLTLRILFTKESTQGIQEEPKCL